MPLAAATPTSLVDQAIDGMRALLDSGEWSVGMRIPPEPALASDLGVSRNTVREAVKALAHLGVLQVRRGDGTYVAATTEMRAVMRRQVSRVNAEHLREVRQALEVRAATLAAQRRTDEDLELLDTITTRRAAALETGDAVGFVEADVDFHRAVVAAAHNPLLADLYDGLVDILRSTIDDLVQALDTSVGGFTGADVLDDEHAAVLDAVRAGNPAAAAAAAADLLDHDPTDTSPTTSRTARR